MKLALDDGELALREEARSFLEANVPDPSTIPHDFDAKVEFLRAWQARLHEAGLVGLSWPEAYGGRGASLTEQIVVNAEMARAGAPIVIGNVGLDVVGPSLVEQGTEEQKERWLDRILSGADIWCQGFSEVGAGSDLAALRTKAKIKDDGSFVIDGHKIWTSYAQHAQWCAVLARTDADAPAHRGISYILVDMSTPGIEIRPLVQVTGDAEFSEVYFDGVEVPAENLLGELHGGWGIAMHTLSHERGWYGVGRQAVLRVLLDGMVEEAGSLKRGGRPALEDEDVRSALARAHIGLEVLKHQGLRSVGQMIADGHPGLESSVDKVVLGRVEQEMAAAGLDALGAHAALGGGAPAGVDPEAWQHVYLYARAGSVYGGAAQIQKNIIAERILGLPRGPR
jgi:alkylation response protein AidB-like acyl-CoA dehydrogenase